MPISPMHGDHGPAFEDDPDALGLRTRDANDTLILLRFGFYVGMPLFFLLAAYETKLRAAGTLGRSAYIALLIADLPIAATVVWLLTFVIGRTAGGMAAMMSGGGSPAPARGYSYEESLVIRGRIAEAVDAYRARIATEPTRLAAHLRLAALLANEAADPAAARTLYLAIRAQAPTLEHEAAISAALLQLAHHTADRSAEREELARQARLFPDHAVGVSARRRLRELARAADAPTRDDEPPTPTE